MALTIEEFCERLVDSKLVSAEDIRSLEGDHETTETEDPVQVLARRLVNAGKLTKYQAGRVYSGRGTGLILGNYVILDKIGQGGMGRVFKARHRRMKRLVALKELPSSLTRSTRAVKRFQREVEVAGQLDHPNIVTAFDADESSGSVFLVMEYVDGQDLAKLVDVHGPFSVDDAIHCVLQTARGLQYAHQRGIVHRDIKPQNLLLDSNGNVKILDMGLVRFSGIGDDTIQGDALTKENQIVGTIDYMSPEQAEDTRQADARADIYSLGCTLHRILTGHAIFAGGSTMKRLLAHREQPIPSLCDQRDDVPPALDGLFQKMVAKRPEDRPQTMAELITELESFQENSSSVLSLDESEREASAEDSALLRFVRTIDEPDSVGLEQRIQIATDTTLQSPANQDTKASSTSGSSGSSASGTASGETSRRLRHRRETHRWVVPGISLAGFSLLVAVVVWWFIRPTYVIIKWDDPDWPGTVLEIDGVPQPDLPAFGKRLWIRLAPGEREIVLKHRQYGRFRQSIVLSSGNQIEIPVKWPLRPPGLAPPSGPSPSPKKQPQSDKKAQTDGPNKQAEPAKQKADDKADDPDPAKQKADDNADDPDPAKQKTDDKADAPDPAT